MEAAPEVRAEPGVPGPPGRAPGAPGRRPGRPTPSTRPALLVVALAVLILVLFGLASLLSSHGSAPPAAPRSPERVPGSSLLATSAGPALAPVERPGSPPANITSNLTVPVGVQVLERVGPGPSTGQYDAHVNLAVHASQEAVVAFYRAELPAQGWRIFSVGPVQNQPRATEVLAQKAGDDGWYWEIGAVVEPTTFPSASAPRSAESTRFTLRLFQRSDEGA